MGAGKAWGKDRAGGPPGRASVKVGYTPTTPS